MAINILPGRFTLGQWRAFWQSRGGSEVLFAEDTRQQAVHAFNVSALGTTIIINREGRVVYRDSGATTYEKLRAEAGRAL